MPINVRCPQGHLLAIVEKYAGRRVRCPKCKEELLVPGSNGSAKAPTASTVPSNGAASSDPKPPPLPRGAARNVEVPPMPAPPISAAPLAMPPVATAAVALPPAPAVHINVKRGGVRGYRAERPRVLTVYWLALGLVALALFQLAPVADRLNPATAPDWARWVMMLSLVQLAFTAWMVSLPDWSTVRVTMFVMAGIATIYCVALGIAVITPHDKPLLLEMDDVRDKVRLWCEAVLLLACLMTYVCGRVGFRWRKAYWTGK